LIFICRKLTKVNFMKQMPTLWEK